MNELTQKALDELYSAKAFLDGINFDYLDEIVGELYADDENYKFRQYVAGDTQDMLNDIEDKVTIMIDRVRKIKELIDGDLGKNLFSKILK